MKLAIIKIKDFGTIKLELFPNIAPISVENFENLANSLYYDNCVFHRIIADFMIQAGGYMISDGSLNELKEVKSIKGEFKKNGIDNPLKHELGVISMARTNVPDSATGQFFICSSTNPWLDGEYAAFGKTIDDLSNNIVLKISQCPTGSLGQGFDDFPYEPIYIESIRVVDNE